jgi:hypothetical protein
MVYLHAKPHPYTKVGKLRGYLYSDMPLLSCQAMRQLSLPHRYLSSSLELLVKVTVSIINNLLYFDSVQSVAFFFEGSLPDRQSPGAVQHGHFYRVSPDQHIAVSTSILGLCDRTPNATSSFSIRLRSPVLSDACNSRFSLRVL